MFLLHQLMSNLCVGVYSIWLIDAIRKCHCVVCILNNSFCVFTLSFLLFVHLFFVLFVCSKTLRISSAPCFTLGGLCTHTMYLLASNCHSLLSLVSCQLLCVFVVPVLPSPFVQLSALPACHIPEFCLELPLPEFELQASLFCWCLCIAYAFSAPSIPTSFLKIFSFIQFVSSSNHLIIPSRGIWQKCTDCQNETLSYTKLARCPKGYDLPKLH